MDQLLAGMMAPQGGGIGQPPAPPTAPAPPDAPPMDAMGGAPPEPPGPQDQAAFEAHLQAFVHEAVKDFAAGKISRADLNKATSYTGGEDYHTWKHDNVERLKAMHKHHEKMNKDRAGSTGGKP